jgi:hypothetical protein
MRLSDRWSTFLLTQPETGMGYQVARLTLRDGRQFDGLIVVDGIASGLPPAVEAGLADDDIVEIVVTHSRELPAALRARVTIGSPGDLQQLLSQIQAAIAAGVLTSSVPAAPGPGRYGIAVPPADGPWPDLIDAAFRDRAGRRYRLFVETYHGAGGAWTPLDAED